jgi:hypothetical protein
LTDVGALTAVFEVSSDIVLATIVRIIVAITPSILALNQQTLSVQTLRIGVVHGASSAVVECLQITAVHRVADPLHAGITILEHASALFARYRVARPAIAPRGANRLFGADIVIITAITHLLQVAGIGALGRLILAFGCSALLHWTLIGVTLAGATKANFVDHAEGAIIARLPIFHIGNNAFAGNRFAGWLAPSMAAGVPFFKGGAVLDQPPAKSPFAHIGACTRVLVITGQPVVQINGDTLLINDRADRVDALCLKVIAIVGRTYALTRQALVIHGAREPIIACCAVNHRAADSLGTTIGTGPAVRFTSRLTTESLLAVSANARPRDATRLTYLPSQLASARVATIVTVVAFAQPSLHHIRSCCGRCYLYIVLSERAITN